MGIFDSLIDCFSNCEGLYSAGSGRVRCYEVCLDKAERLLELSIKDKIITADEAELLRKLIGSCRLNVSKVEGLKDYCTNKYEELRKARSEEQARAGTPSKPVSTIAQGAPTTQETQGRLTECYEHCVKFHGDNQVALQTCYSICDALWGQKAECPDLGLFEGCFPQGVMELEEFMAKYRRIGRSGFEDWQIVAEVESVVIKMLEEGRKSECPDTEDTITRIITNSLDCLGIDRYSIRRGYGHGIPEEARKIVSKVFPNMEWVWTPKPAPPMPLPRDLTPPPPSPQLEPLPRPGKGRWARDAAAITLVILGLFAWIYGVFIAQIMLPVIIAFIFALIALVLRPRWYSGLWFFIVLISTLIMLGAGTPFIINSTSSAPQPSSPQISITAPQSVSIGPSWVDQFIGIVNQYRAGEGAPPLQYCPWLSNFAQVRFNTMVMNPTISHYGYEEDYQEYLGQYQGFLITGEEALFPSGYIPSQFVQYVINNAPIHWKELMNPNYTYYGYYIGYGPSYVVVGSCPVTEIPGPGINIPQYFQSMGCQVELENTTWLVIELSSWCSGPVTISVTAFSIELYPQYYEYVPIQYSLPTNQQYVTLNVYVNSTGPVRLFIFTPDQYEYFKSLYTQQVWDFFGPAYYYGGESTIFNTQVLLNTQQLSDGGYYLVISNVLPSASTVSVFANITITYTPQTPNIQT